MENSHLYIFVHSIFPPGYSFLIPTAVWEEHKYSIVGVMFSNNENVILCWCAHAMEHHVLEQAVGESVVLQQSTPL